MPRPRVVVGGAEEEALPLAADPQSPAVAADGAPEPEGSSPPRAGGPASFLDTLEVGWLDLLCVGPIIAASLWSLLGQPIAPSLIGTHPVLLAFLRGSIAAMITCGARAHDGVIPLWQALLAPLPILVWVDPFYYWAGRRYGRLLLDHYKRQGPRMGRRIDRAERTFARFGMWAIVASPFLPIQAFLLLAAGETRMPLWRFAIADLVGNLLWIGFVVSLGWFAHDQANAIVDKISHYGLILSGVILVVVVVLVWRQSRAAMQARQ